MIPHKELAETILSQILQGRASDGGLGYHCMMAWGAHAYRYHRESKEEKHLGALSFRVNGFLFRGIVQVELTYSDTYRIRLKKRYSESVKQTVEDVYCDELTAQIDQLIEHPGDQGTYEQLCDQALYSL